MIKNATRELHDNRLPLLMPTSLRTRLDRTAEELERPAAWIVRKALTEWLDRHESGLDA